ncbi:hypothetical protein [Sulfurovum sp.]|uniref:hypothetical protein n=1 Tax=Sulfurovum sp. TaxID=1969726 RepID=UPI0025DF403B|nr:hypothetical protein [Sulfurovum sp.]
MKKYFILLLIFFITGCDSDPLVTFYNKNIQNKKIDCMQLSVMPKDKEITSTLQDLYPFSQTCNYRLEVSFKDNIVCNSHYNAQSKALGKMPSSYLKMELRHGLSLQYSYYIDLDHKPNSSDLQKGFDRLKKDLEKPLFHP